MQATVFLIAALAVGGWTAGPKDDDRGVHQAPDSWRPWATDTTTVPGSRGRSSRSKGNGSSHWSSCRTLPGPNGISYLECKGGRPGGPDSAFEGTTPADGAAGPVITPEMLLEEALRQVQPPPPAIHTAPPRGREGYVGVRHFYWADRDQWRSITKRASAGAVWAEVTATPSRLVIDPGVGQARLTCQGPGTPYDFNKSPDRQDTSCTHIYTRSSAGLKGSQYTATVSVVWTATWVGSGGAGGPLAPITVSTTFPVRIAEGQALVQRSA